MPSKRPSLSASSVSSSRRSDDEEMPATFVIAGGGIVGMTLALAIKKHLGLTPEIYEKARGFAEDVGAGLGVYPNGLRVLRDIDPQLLQEVREAGKPYLYRIWETHEGTEVAKASEEVLAGGEADLMSIGIKRWKLQDALYAAIARARIPIHFRKAVSSVTERWDGTVEVEFTDGTSRLTEVLFGADGAHSAVRQCMADPPPDVKYTGVTCLMGIAKSSNKKAGIHFPSSVTSKFHAVYFPVSETEQCFQIHLPVNEKDSDKSEWGNLSKADGKVQFERVANEMEKDGWDDQFTDPLLTVDHAVRVGFALLEPRLTKWVYGSKGRIILVGDAAHPPVPYVGQGAQMGIEDAGTIALLMKEFCFDADSECFHFSQFAKATRIYEKLRVPRTGKILDCSKKLGELQEKRSNVESNRMADLMVKGEVMMDDTLQEMLPGATFNYAEEVKFAVKREKRKATGIGRRSSSSTLSKDKMDEALEALWGGSNPFLIQ